MNNVIDPGSFPRRILLCVTGLTPQVATETLYALAVAAPFPFVPSELHLITTAEGADRARLMLLDPDTGQFHALCRDYGLSGIRFDASCIHMIGGADGPLTDIRTAADNRRAADTITALVRGFCADPDAALHVSLAGGRKTMGFYLGYALSLFAREQDRLSHVLVSEHFETNHEFYYPPKKPRVLFTHDNKPVSTRDAHIELADIPFVSLRNGLPTELLTGEFGFSEVVARTARNMATPLLLIDLVQGRARAGDVVLKLPPILLAWLALLADARVAGLGDEGYVCHRDPLAARLLALYRHLVGEDSAALDRLAAQLGRDPDIPESFFREKTTKLRARLREQLGGDALPYLPATRGQRPQTRTGLPLPGRQVSIVWDRRA